LLTHAHSYEALEEAPCALLAIVAERAGYEGVIAAARQIEAEEIATRAPRRLF
jgi:hypothetical protein